MYLRTFTTKRSALGTSRRLKAPAKAQRPPRSRPVASPRPGVRLDADVLALARLADVEVVGKARNDLLTHTVAIWETDEDAMDLLTPAQLAGYITFAYGQMHWSRLPLPDAMKLATAEAIRGAINDRIMQFG